MNDWALGQFGHAQGMNAQVMGAFQNENNSRVLQAQAERQRQHERQLQQQQLQAQMQSQAMQQNQQQPQNSRYNHVQRYEASPLHASQGGIIEAELAAKGQVGAAQAGAVGQAAAAQGNADMGRYGAMGNVATAMANERSSAYTAAAMAEAARQAAVGNIGSAGLGAAGSAAGSAMGAWGQNQAAYKQALAGMSNGGIGGMAAFGISGGGAPGGDFWATGPGGPVASGNYGGGGAPGGGGGAGYGDMLGFARENIGRLDAEHYSSRGMPSQMLDQTFSGLGNLANQAYAQNSQGMNQFYGFAQDPANKGDYSGVLAGLGRSGGSSGGATQKSMFGKGTIDFDTVSPYVDALGMGKPQSRWVAQEQAIRDKAKYQDTRRGLRAGGYAV